jgi:hypothetical protein
MKRFLLLLACLVSLLQTVAAASAPALRVEVVGKKGGRPLLLVPGYVAPGELWRETAAELGRPRAARNRSAAAQMGIDWIRVALQKVNWCGREPHRLTPSPKKSGNGRSCTNGSRNGESKKAR